MDHIINYLEKHAVRIAKLHKIKEITHDQLMSVLNLHPTAENSYNIKSALRTLGVIAYGGRKYNSHGTRESDYYTVNQQNLHMLLFSHGWFDDLFDDRNRINVRTLFEKKMRIFP